LTTSERGLFWSQAGSGTSAVYRISFDGGSRITYPAVNPQAVAATGTRVVWTSDPGSNTCKVFDEGTGVLAYATSPAFGSPADGGNPPVAVDYRNVAFADDGGTVAATANVETERITSNNNDVFFTSTSSSAAGYVYERSAGAGSVNELASTSPSSEGAPIFLGADGTIYWSDSETSISYCLPPGPGLPCNDITILPIDQGAINHIMIFQIAVTSKHIFFSGRNNSGQFQLYRVDRL
jgi:hypothetical protein